MDWIVLALLSAIMVSFAALLEKKVLIKEHAMEFATVLSIVSACLSLPFFLTIDYSLLTVQSLLIVFFVSVLAAIAYILIAKSMRHISLADSAALLVMAPALTAILAAIFLGERLSAMQTSGLILLLIGAYVLELKAGAGFWEPFRIFKTSYYYHLLLIGIVIYAIASLYDRVLLTRYNMQPEAIIAFAHLFIAVISFTIFTRFYNGMTGIKNGLKNYGWVILLCAMLTVAHRYTQLEAAQLAFIGLVAAIKRSSTLFTVLIGGEIFHESNIVRKALAAAIMVGGVLLITLS